MRRTLTLDDGVLKAAKRRARDEERPLKDVINEERRDQTLEMTERADALAFFGAAGDTLEDERSIAW